MKFDPQKGKCPRSWRKTSRTEFVFRKRSVCREFFSFSLIFSPPAPPSVHYGSALVNPPHHAYLMSPKIAKMRLGSDLFSFFKSRFRAITVFYWSFHRSIWVAFSFSFSLFPFKKCYLPAGVLVNLFFRIICIHMKNLLFGVTLAKNRPKAKGKSYWGGPCFSLVVIVICHATKVWA